MSDWRDLASELDSWRQARRDATLWWRDDDAVEPTPALERLLSLAADGAAPLALAVIPARASRALADRLAGEGPGVTVLQHGFQPRRSRPRGGEARRAGRAPPAGGDPRGTGAWPRHPAGAVRKPGRAGPGAALEPDLRGPDRDPAGPRVPRALDPYAPRARKPGGGPHPVQYPPGRASMAAGTRLLGGRGGFEHPGRSSRRPAAGRRRADRSPGTLPGPRRADRPPDPPPGHGRGGLGFRGKAA